MKTISDRLTSIEKSAATDLSEAELLKAVQANLSQVESGSTKTLAGLIFLSIVLELLHRASVTEVSFLGLKVTDLALARKVLPVGLAYLYFSSLSYFAAHRINMELLYAICRRAHPSLIDSGLWNLLGPISPIRAFYIVEALIDGRLKKLFEILSAPIMMTIVFFPPMFLIYSYWGAFRVFGAVDLILWVSLTLSSLFLIKGAVYIIAVNEIAPADA